MLIQDFLESTYGYDKSVRDAWDSMVALWESWYKGKVSDFHTYRIYNGRHFIKREKMSMQLAKKICEDWADLLMNERVIITVDNAQSQVQLDEVLNKLDFWNAMNKAIERSGAVGTGAIVTRVTNIKYYPETNTLEYSEAEPAMDYVPYQGIYPISWDNKGIKEVAFAAEKIDHGKKFIDLSVHVLNEAGNYEIRNHVFEVSNSGQITEVTDDENPIAVFDTMSNMPWFAILHPAICNNINSNVPWGLPYYANAIDSLKACDSSYDALNNEITLGRRRIFMRQEAIAQTPDGEEYRTFDENDVEIYVLPDGFNKEDIIQNESPQIRSTEIISTLESQLSELSNKVGFGQDFYTFSPAQMATATQVVSQNSAMFRRKKKHEIVLESAIYDIITALAYAASHFGAYSIDTAGLTIHFDDSIVEDTEAISSRMMRELNNNLITAEEYRQKVYGESEETAREAIDMIRQRRLEDMAAQPTTDY